MVDSVAKMTRAELQELIENAVEQKLMELLGDPDEGLTLKSKVRQQLLRQKKAVREGERGHSLEQVLQRLGVE